MEIGSDAKYLVKIALVSKAVDVTNEIVDILVKHNCTVEEARELMRGYYEGFDEAIQKDPSILNKSLSYLTFLR